MMHNPPHPGEIIREDILGYLNLGVTQAAKMLGVSRVAFSRVLNGKAGISPDLAIRLEMAGLSTARLWVTLQAHYDLYQAQKLPHEGVMRFPVNADDLAIQESSALGQ